MVSQHVIDYINKQIARLQARKLRAEEAGNITAIDAKIAELQTHLP